MTDSEQTASEIRIIGGSPTPEEVAAVTAVVQATLDELAAEEALLSGVRTTAWQRSQRGLRGELRPGAGAWRGFSG